MPPADPAAFRGRTWVTRPRPHVDRLASVWLIRRFVDPEARIRYGGDSRPGEVGFDLAPGAPPEIESFGHTGPLCTFETLLVAFRLEDPALRAVAALVHAIDLPDEGPQPAEAAGVDAVLRGWLAAGLPDDELERLGTALFEGLYATCRQAAARAPGAGGAERSKKAGAAPAGPAGGGKRRPAKRRAR